MHLIRKTLSKVYSSAWTNLQNYFTCASDFYARLKSVLCCRNGPESWRYFSQCKNTLLDFVWYQLDKATMNCFIFRSLFIFMYFLYKNNDFIKFLVVVIKYRNISVTYLGISRYFERSIRYTHFVMSGHIILRHLRLIVIFLITTYTTCVVFPR